MMSKTINRIRNLSSGLHRSASRVGWQAVHLHCAQAQVSRGAASGKPRTQVKEEQVECVEEGWQEEQRGGPRDVGRAG
jgi:hypothetical protein